MSQPPEARWAEEDEEAPLHGFRGDRAARARPTAPGGLTVALSRESGARGGAIARLVGRRLGWPVYDQEHLEFLSGDPVARANLMDDLSPACVAWFEARVADVERTLDAGDDGLHHLIRLVSALGARGEAVILGRGAGQLLPAETTLNVRVIAPLAERVAYLAQWMRLSAAEAEQKVHARDAQRAQFLRDRLHRSPADVHQYDLVLNTSHLGEEACAELIAGAVRLRWEQLGGG
ncbi:MAG: AAA family ATPase [Gemmataceae bacterium]